MIDLFFCKFDHKIELSMEMEKLKILAPVQAIEESAFIWGTYICCLLVV